MNFIVSLLAKLVIRYNLLPLYILCVIMVSLWPNWFHETVLAVSVCTDIRQKFRCKQKRSAFTTEFASKVEKHENEKENSVWYMFLIVNESTQPRPFWASVAHVCSLVPAHLSDNVSDIFSAEVVWDLYNVCLNLFFFVLLAC